jgi:hypothetical protein
MMKGIFFFLVAFVVACIVLLTFMQEPFRVLVPAKLMWYQTPAIPVYYFLIGAFVIGLLFGLVTLMYYWGSLSMALTEQKRLVRDKDKELENLRGSVKSTEAEASSGDTSSQPSLPQKDIEA